MLRTTIVAALIALTPVGASAKDTGTALTCDNTLARGQPAIIKPAGRTQLLCYRAYAVLYSNQTRTALWSAERLTREAVEAARQLPRDSDFYEEGRLAVTERARLADYGRGSGYDRGHLAPSGDFGDKESQAESFSLANVIPQNPVSNRRTWSHIETSTRRLVRKVGTVYVVTGPAFIRDVGELRGRVRIPDFVWKAVYIPGVGAAAYVVRNDDTLAYSVISIDELARFSGVDAFPTLPKPMRSAAFDLPAPTPHPGEKAARRVGFPWLESGESIGSTSGVEPSAKLVQRSRAILALAFAR